MVPVFSQGTILLTLEPLSDEFPESPLTVDTDPALPSGWALRTSDVPAGDAGVQLVLSTPPAKEDAGEPGDIAWSGHLYVVDARRRLVAGEPVTMRWEADPLAQARTAHVWWFLLGNAVLWSALAAVGFHLFRSRATRRQRTVPHGRLVPTDNRTRRVTTPLDLRNVSLRRGKMRLLLGRGKDADLLLLHDDVQARHAWLSIVPDPDTDARVQILPLNGASCTVNGTHVTETVDLQDGDKVRFGALRFLFEMAELYRPVIVECLDGRRIEGFPVDWDTTAPGFMLRPRDGSTVDPVQVVPFQTIRAVHFVTDWDPDLAARLQVEPQYPAGDRVRLRFRDGLEWDGTLTANYNPDLPRFHFLPRDLDGVIVSLIERSALDTVAVLST